MIVVDLAEPVNPVDANAPSNYDLRRPGLNMTYDDADDVVLPVDPDYVAGSRQIQVTVQGGLRPGEYRLTLIGDSSIHDTAGLRLDGDGDGIEGGNYVRIFAVEASVVGRHVFYNNSAFDQNNSAANASDDAAIAPDKTALLPGETATFANYTSYSGGLNGIMIDIANPGGPVTQSDLAFRIGNDANPEGWSTAPAPASVSVRTGGGENGADRITIIWADHAIANVWLQVTVLANATTGLVRNDVFYFGNTPAETGDSPASAAVDQADRDGDGIGDACEGATVLQSGRYQ